jgi:hypothetical protein
MNSNHVEVHHVHAGLISHLSAMLHSILAMRDAQLDWLTTAAAACGYGARVGGPKTLKKLHF